MHNTTPEVCFVYDEAAEKLTHAVKLNGNTSFMIKSHNGSYFTVEFEPAFKDVSAAGRTLYESNRSGELTVELTTAEIPAEGYGYVITQDSHVWDPRVMP